MKRAAVILGLAGCTIVLAAAATPARISGGPDDVADLRAEVTRLEERIERLENQATRSDPSFYDDDLDAEPAPSGDAPPRTMILDGIEEITASDDGQEELDRLRDEAAALERTVEQHERQISSMTTSRRGGSNGYRGSSYGRNLGASDARRSKQRLLSDYKRQLGQKRGEVRKLEKQLNEPKQIITGHWGDTIFTLTTTSDLARSLSRVQIGDPVTWRGRRTGTDAVSESWIVTSVSRAD